MSEDRPGGWDDGLADRELWPGGDESRQRRWWGDNWSDVVVDSARLSRPVEVLDRRETPGRITPPERSGPQDRPGLPDRAERTVPTERPARPERTARTERPDRTARTGQPARPDRTGPPDLPERSARAERVGRSTRPSWLQQFDIVDDEIDDGDYQLVDLEPGTGFDHDAEPGLVVEVDTDPEDDVEPDVWLDLDERADGESTSTSGTGLRYLKVLAGVGLTGWALAMVMTLLNPSNVVDTTNRDDADDDTSIPDDEEFGIGGGVVGEADDAQVMRVGEADAASIVGSDGTGSTEADDGSGQAGASSATATATPETGDNSATPPEVPPASGDYESNLAMIRAASARNTNHDASRFRDTPSAQLVATELYGPRSDYLGNPGGSPEQAFPVPQGGQFRTACEFSHFAYDDPLVLPGQAGASHLHMFFGNTDVNAHSTYESLIDSGGSTCNGGELNRTGYWVPALFDDQGNVRVPDRVVVYYKGEGLARGNSEVYPAEAAMVVTDNYNALPVGQGGVGGGKLSYQCSDNFSTNTGQGGQVMAACDGSMFSGPGRWTVLEVNIKFPTCWNGQDPSNWENFRPGAGGGWYGSNCQGEFSRTLPNLEYFVNYRVDPGENTANWFLSSDVDPTSFGASRAAGGSTIHGDWWGGWHQATNQLWIDNCVNRGGGAPTGCGFGYLSDGGPNGSAPFDGPALQIRPQYTGPHKVPAAEVLADLCPNPNRAYSKPEDAAYCQPA